MADQDKSELRQTVLHEWHVAHQGKMVPFGGWDMPVQYKTGIIGEHLATRRNCGLFDVSHMGRFMVRGKGAQAFLLKVLTNSARALEVGQAQYTFIATDTGGAVDDAYLYRLGEEDYLLVVNAANRDKDWDWLAAHNHQPDVSMENISEELGMISLQGPNSAELMEQIADKRDLPESKRNWLRTVTIDGVDVIVARTGYTGESIGFELFPPRDYTVALWEKLIALGAAPIGLGARDSLRLEAGLPLYGHELGEDSEQREIPVFANDLARFAVRPPDEQDYVGKQALEGQRREFIGIKRGELDAPLGERVLPRIIQPIAVFSGRRPLRAGYRVFHDGREVGCVTSGTTVPYTRFYGEGITATPSDEHDLRPIGLALIDSNLTYRTDRPVALEVRDDRGNSVEAELVERHLWPAAPFARTYTGFARAPEAARADDPVGAVHVGIRRCPVRRRPVIPLQRAQSPEGAGRRRAGSALLQGHRLHHGQGRRAQGGAAQFLRMLPGGDPRHQRPDGQRHGLRRVEAIQEPLSRRQARGAAAPGARS
jgi:aminomethyltransferase